MNHTNLGYQGGDQRNHGGVQLDLSTCVNPYGPPPAVMAVLRNLSESIVRAHPYEAAARVEHSYAGHLGRPVEEFVASRGTSEMIWILAREMQGYKVGLPMPTYSEFRRAFVGAQTYGGGPSTHLVETLDEAMRDSEVVVLSNPHNPTGQVIERRVLADLAAIHTSTRLIVDESYIDFLANGDDVTLVGCEVDNVVVLRSPSKFYGLAGLRSGVVWSRRSMRSMAEAWRTPWPVSALAAEALERALRQQSWAVETRSFLASDGAWLADALKKSELDVTEGLLHFRLVTASANYVAKFVNLMNAHGILVRVMGDDPGIGSPAVRIAAPRHEARQVLAAALVSGLADHG
jgi:histidinol-phosphate/aromatic aminotransferase/cobyric acid decarboxylase-like protein